MPTFHELLLAAHSGLAPGEALSPEREQELARRCEAAQVPEILARLTQLADERDRLPAWDGDSADDIWQAEMQFTRVLSLLAHRFLQAVLSGLDSPAPRVRCWAVRALKGQPDALVRQRLQRLFQQETDELVLLMLRDVLQSGSPEDTSPAG